MTRLLLAALGIALQFVVITPPATAQRGADAELSLTRPQEAAARQLARRFVDGNVSVQVFTAEHTARVCFKSALSRGSSDTSRNARLSAREMGFFAECAESQGFRLRAARR
jgi:hypothetical protein